MTSINRPDPIIKSIIGIQENNSEKNRISQYVIEESVDNGYLLYHTLTCELVFVTHEEYTHLEDIAYLVDNWFVVPYDFDEYQFAKRARTLRQAVYRYETKKNFSESVKRYWILTTTTCNARCYYCHENGIPKMTMTPNIAEDVVNYVEQNSPDKTILLNWYGGEPLCNSRVIDIISSKLTEKGFDFSSSMISNGLLFDEDMVRKAASLWNLKQVQITLDGLEKTYNRVKAYVDKKIDNPFNVVINNISMLLDNKINVHIRLNIDGYNKEELFELSDYLIERFDSKYLSIYSAPLFEECLGTDYRRTAGERDIVYNAHFQLTEKLNNAGVLLKTELPQVIKSETRCIAVSRVRVIFPDGQLAFCHDYMKGVLSGSIYTGEPDMKENFEYTQCLPFKPKCNVCAKFPQCVRLVKCFNNKCNEQELRTWINQTKLEMVWAYQDFVNENVNKNKQSH